jgi:3-oxoacyl-[acyl-carrier protein] reductase
MRPFSLENEICLVTGATRGIGQAIALALAEHGATVVGTATSDSGSEMITDYMKEKHISGFGAVLDVTDAAACMSLVKRISSELAPPTVLVNNAGITRDNLLLRMQEQQWDEVLETNLKSIYHMSKACLRGMTKLRRGRIINITSVVGVSGNSGQCNYAAAKAGMIGFTKSLAREIATRGITVNAVAPGLISTDMTRRLDDEQRQTLLAQIPLARLGNVEEIAYAVVFLASPAAAYVTGATLHVNGGMYMAS